MYYTMLTFEVIREAKPWLPIDASAKNLTVNIQEQKNDSMLNFTRQEIAKRKGIAT